MELMKNYSDLLNELGNFKMSKQIKRYDFFNIKPMELKAMRYSRGVKPNQLSRLVGLTYEELIHYEKSADSVPPDLAKKYVVALGISPNEYKRLRELLNGTTDGYEQDRRVPTIIAKQAKERDDYKCVNCGKSDKLHLHHIKPFSEGGLHQLDNLITLCGDCHTEAHKGDFFYNMMKVNFGEG